MKLSRFRDVSVHSFQDTAGSDLDWRSWNIVSSARDSLQSVENLHTIGDLTKDNMSTVKMGSGSEAEEELRAVGSWASVGHGKDTTSSVLVDEVLVFEVGSVDGLAASAVVCSEITTLSHEASDDSVESASLETESFLASAKLLEVLGGLGSVSSERDRDSASTLAANGNVKEDFCVNSVCHILLILSFCFINKL